ncbi:hypothetical protein ACRAWG_22975 [Methylobacterium sp. P31]
MTGLLYWFRYGDGMAQIDRHLGDRHAAAKLRAKTESAFRAAPVQTTREPADAAGVLTYLVAIARGTPTPEQVSVIEAEMRAITPPGDNLAGRMVHIRHAAEQAADISMVIRHLAPVLREKLTPSERSDLGRMLETVAAAHRGPIPRRRLSSHGRCAR